MLMCIVNWHQIRKRRCHQWYRSWSMIRIHQISRITIHYMCWFIWYFYFWCRCQCWLEWW